MEKLTKQHLSLVRLKEAELNENELNEINGGGGCCKCGSIFTYFGLGSYILGPCNVWGCDELMEEPTGE